VTVKTVRIRGAASLRRVLRQAPADMAEGVRSAIKAGSEAVLSDMLANVPRDSGDLAEVTKIKASRDGMSARIGPGVAGKRDMKKAGWRAHFAEFGTQKMGAQPFVRPALRRNRAEVESGISKGISSALLKIAGKGGGGD
jgi:HK97 gp10 family phage protein